MRTVVLLIVALGLASVVNFIFICIIFNITLSKESTPQGRTPHHLKETTAAALPNFRLPTTTKKNNNESKERSISTSTTHATEATVLATEQNKEQQNDNKKPPLTSKDNNDNQSWPTAPFNFSACLLVKDDNRILPEWLAYHYTVLPLRHLVLGLDPFTLSSPLHVVQTFRDIGMEITVWKATDFLKDGQFIPTPESTDRDKFNFHYARQEVFMSQCLTHFRDNGKSWVLLVDSDEYVTFHNFENVGSEGLHRDCRPLPPEPRQECVHKVNTALMNGTHARARLPRIGQATLADYIYSQRFNNNSMLNQYSCIVLPRIWMPAKESKRKKIFANVPRGFDPKQFSTLRYRHHSYFQNRFPGKSIVDVSKLNKGSTNETKTVIKVGNPHRVLGKDCKYGPFVNTGESLFRIHHYIGSPEAFISRPGDTHRTMEEFQKRNSYKVAGQTDVVRMWLSTFVNLVGEQKAHEATDQLMDWASRTNAAVTTLSLQNNTLLRDGPNQTIA